MNCLGQLLAFLLRHLKEFQVISKFELIKNVKLIYYINHFNSNEAITRIVYFRCYYLSRNQELRPSLALCHLSIKAWHTQHQLAIVNLPT